MTESTYSTSELIELLAYMITSARGLLDEPASYGPFRLIDGASRLCGIMAEAGSGEADFLNALQIKIDEQKFSVMSDAEQFNNLLDEAVKDITLHLVEKSESI